MGEGCSEGSEQGLESWTCYLFMAGGGPAPLNAHRLAITAAGAFGKELPRGLQVGPLMYRAGEILCFHVVLPS